MADQSFAVAVFPFLKTTGIVRIGNYFFRSTDDIEQLPEDQAAAVRDIREMLFVNADIRVKSASYAIVTDIEVHSASQKLQHLEAIRDVVAYFYSAPHDIFDAVFLHPETASLALFQSGPVSTFLARQEHHTETVSPGKGPAPDAFHNVPGYRGIYNFRHSFWVEHRGRLYGPMPHMSLNISQNLQADIAHGLSRQSPILLQMLEQPMTPATARVLNAIRWYNAANENGLDESRAILNLAVAFEALLRLPKAEKTERLVDSISLLLGRTERLEEWAQQFYAARSAAAHEGAVSERFFFVGKGVEKAKKLTSVSGSLMLYGRQIFQLCLRTLLVGIDLAARANLQERFISNNERYQKICDALDDADKPPSERLLGIASTVEALEYYRFVATAVDTPVLLSAAKRAAATLEACKLNLPDEVKDCLAKLSQGKRKDGERTQLEAVSNVVDALEKAELVNQPPEARTAFELIRLVWSHVFQRYFHLKGLLDKGAEEPSGG